MSLFTPAEEKALERRLEGDKADPTGIYAARVKPKIKELLLWFKKKRELERLLK